MQAAVCRFLENAIQVMLHSLVDVAHDNHVQQNHCYDHTCLTIANRLVAALKHVACGFININIFVGFQKELQPVR